MNSAKLHIARVLLAFFCLVSFRVSADQASDIQGIKGTLEILNEWLQADQYQFFLDWKQDELDALGDIVPVAYQNRVLQALAGVGVTGTFQWSETDNVRSYLEALTRSVYGQATSTTSPKPGSILDNQKKQIKYFAELLDLMDQVTNRLASSSSSSSGSSADILAGNPWWATNSAFSHLYATASQVHPQVSGNNLMSFPELMSFWSAQLMPFSGSGRVNGTSPSAGDYWLKMWGLNRQNSGNTWQGRSFSWFDFMGEIAKSNLVADTTRYNGISRSLADIYQVLSQLDVTPAVSVTNLINVIVTNSASGSCFTNILNAQDILAGNPWWATNSGFQTEWDGYNTYHPYPDSGYLYSFPEFASVQSATRIRALQLFPDLYNAFGLSRPFLSGYGVNPDQGLYTFEDWIADFLKSNVVLTTSSHATNIEEELYQAGYDTEVSITNTPLPQYEFPVEDVSGLQSTVESGESSVNAFLESIQKPGTAGDSEIVLIPEFTVGGIHVSEYRADLDSPIVPYCRRVLIFLYYVGVGVFMFQLAKSEYVYYATLGRHWGKF